MNALEHWKQVITTAESHHQEIPPMNPLSKRVVWSLYLPDVDVARGM